jgi:hypothetical protein
MNCVKWCLLALAFASVLVTGRAFAAPSIVGDVVEIWGVAQSNGAEFHHATVPVIDPGVEYTETILITDIYELDFRPAAITLNSLDNWYSPWFNSGFPPSRLEFRDIDVPGMPWLSIGGVNVLFSETIVPEDDAPVGYPAFSSGNVSFTSDSVALEIGPYRFPTGSRVQIDLTFVPEPATVTLLGVPMVAGLCLRRRRQVRL